MTYSQINLYFIFVLLFFFCKYDQKLLFANLQRNRIACFFFHLSADCTSPLNDLSFILIKPFSVLSNKRFRVSAAYGDPRAELYNLSCVSSLNTFLVLVEVSIKTVPKAGNEIFIF